MKRWLIVVIPALILGSLLFLKPPALTGNKSPALPTSTSQPGTKPALPGGGDEGGKPSYGGHEADDYGSTPKKK